MEDPNDYNFRQQMLRESRLGQEQLIGLRGEPL
jgi:hypothetical protein